ncbi:MAG: type II toxin-antitoxin system RelE/ParE family toxin [Thiomicrospira sp.]|nr:type II toxin-antitoxin system RelE/ParE family toxin [Thiomicrospira sp.]
MKVEWTKKARKQLAKLGNPAVAQKIYAAVTAFSNGEPVDIKPLTAHEYTHRIRVGNHRILMTIADEIQISWIEEVKKRDERTY